ncbi:hypothetical protein Q5P01_023996 [Channa striata]|uniref:Uncharacterized protein n=1 Tax=Channa striata TaxID=64152 RepID=A0AA88IXE5_CHASR|nr:hypothetical protein Q5P01_023996 [Channa striata]
MLTGSPGCHRRWLDVFHVKRLEAARKSSSRDKRWRRREQGQLQKEIRLQQEIERGRRRVILVTRQVNIKI